MRLPQVDEAVNGPFAMLWGLLISLASLVTRSVVKGASPTGRERCHLFLHVLLTCSTTSCAEGILEPSTGYGQTGRVAA